MLRHSLSLPRLGETRTLRAVGEFRCSGASVRFVEHIAVVSRRRGGKAMENLFTIELTPRLHTFFHELQPDIGCVLITEVAIHDPNIVVKLNGERGMSVVTCHEGKLCGWIDGIWRDF
jgi:hypothetical protein